MYCRFVFRIVVITMRDFQKQINTFSSNDVAFKGVLSQ